MQLSGKVNNQEALVLLDSGASISVVPESMVTPDQKTGSMVAVKPFGSKKPLLLPTAEVPIQIGALDWVEHVAVAPWEEGAENEVLYSLNLKSQRGLELVLLANKLEQKDVLRVTTRAQAKEDSQSERADAKVVAEEDPNVKPLLESERAGQIEVSIEAQGTEEGKPAADRPVRVVPEPVASASALEGLEERAGSLGRKEEELVEEILADELDSSVERDDVQFELRADGGKGVDLRIPPVKSGNSSRAELVEQTKMDPSLEEWRKLADSEEQGFKWQDGLLYQATTSQVFETVYLMALPEKFRMRVLHLAHEKLGHLGARKVKSLIKQRFTWPGVGQDVIDHYRSCPVCQKCSKAPARKVPLIEREVLTEPFEALAFDIVGPMPKGKGGYRFLLTAICMASKWPEAIPLRSIMAKAVAQGMMEIFARTGIPLQLLTDQRAQFVGSLVTKLCKDLNIDKIKTTPYHPECNGVVERMHGTLGAMLTKASSVGLDWVAQIPFALFALRSAPNRDTHFSPFQLVYGHQVRTPLDILHQGWAEVTFKELDASAWSGWLAERLEPWHDVLRERGRLASQQRKASFDRKAVNRQLEEGDLVLCRVPGMSHKLEESWHGPYPVIEKVNRVDYRVDLGRGRKKVLHISNLKKFYVSEEEVMRLALVAEDWEDDKDVGTKTGGVCVDFDPKKLVEMEKEFPEAFSDLPGKTDVCLLTIRTLGEQPIASHPYRIPDRLKDGVREEVLKLVELGIVMPSQSPWASLVVPVPKQDGSVRVCIDYRCLNEVTLGDPYYMCTLEEILERVGGSKAISKLNLTKGFYQIGVDPASIDKTAFITPFGKYAFQRMPFGLKNAPAIFQRCMEIVLGDCYTFAAPYIDDIIVFSENGVVHAHHLRKVFAALQQHGLTVKLDKCEFGRCHVEYLGHVIGNGVLAVPKHRAAAMAAFIQPRTKSSLGLSWGQPPTTGGLSRALPTSPVSYHQLLLSSGVSRIWLLPGHQVGLYYGFTKV